MTALPCPLHRLGDLPSAKATACLTCYRVAAGILGIERARRIQVEAAFEAWQSHFGTSQLSHASARLDAAESRGVRLDAALRQAREALIPFAKLDITHREHEDRSRIVLAINDTQFTLGNLRRAQQVLTTLTTLLGERP